MAARRYIVGGAVRDALLGLPAADRDWVVVGATPAELIAQGLRPVGKDFPVFIDPASGEEVALARTERKTAPGYHGFAFHAAPEVTLEQDLARRDLTINAIAQAEDGTLVDPYGGRRDLERKLLRHVSDAFVEDPVRLLRLARLAARFHDFTVAPETMALLCRMVAEGEVDALVPERVWQEISRGLMAARPSRMIHILVECGAWPRLLPELEALADAAPRPAVLDFCAAQQAPLPVRWACLAHGAAQAAALGERLRVPGDCRELAALAAREVAAVEASLALDAAATVQLFERCDAWRRPQRFGELLEACACLALAESLAPGDRLARALRLAQAVDATAAAQAALARGARGPAVGLAVQAARVAAVQAG